jgi:hypothetical protein
MKSRLFLKFHPPQGPLKNPPQRLGAQPAADPNPSTRPLTTDSRPSGVETVEMDARRTTATTITQRKEIKKTSTPTLRRKARRVRVRARMGVRIWT